jgi:hypothetical protein
VSGRATRTALALMAAELRGDHEGTAVIVAARLAIRREVPDDALAELASRHLIRLADDG